MRSLVIVLSLAMPSIAARAATISDQDLLTLSQEDVVETRPKSDISREEFYQDWGQFEVRIPKERFPIPAPHCRKNVILRIPGVPPQIPTRAHQLERRWNMFQALLALTKNKDARVELPLAHGPYVERGSTGERELQYCNAYVDSEGLKAKQTP